MIFHFLSPIVECHYDRQRCSYRKHSRARSELLLVSRNEVLVDIVVGATGDGEGNHVVEDDGESVVDGINEDGVEVGDIGVLVVGRGSGNVARVGLLSVEEAEEEIGGLVDSDGTEPGAEGNNDTVGQVLVVDGGDLVGIDVLPHLVHLEGELKRSRDNDTSEHDVANEVHGLDETEHVTDGGVTTVGLEGGAGEVGVVSLNTNADGGGSDPDGGEDTGDDANEATSGGVEDGDAVTEGLLTLGAEEAPDAGGASNKERSEVVVIPLGLQVVEEHVDLGPVEAGVEDAGLSGILGGLTVAVGTNGSSVSAALNVVEERSVSDVLDEKADILKAVAAGATEGERASRSSHDLFFVY
jgi:hypothetical protein